MKPFIPTAQQARAIQSRAPRLAVRAAAGSGKTGVLVQRYLRMIEEEGLTPDHILALTFTRKAAAEMKERIVVSLEAKGLRSMAQMAETGPIQTFHSWCERFLRENAFLTGLDPAFTVLAESQAMMEGRRALQESILDLADEHQGVRELLREHALANNAFGSPREGSFFMELEEFLNFYRGSGLSPDDLIPLTRSADAVLSNWLKAVLDDCGISEEPGRDEVNPEFRLKALAPEIRARRPGSQSWLGLDPGEDRRLAVKAWGLIAIVRDAWSRLEARMHEEQAYDFLLIEALCMRSLASVPELGERVREKVKRILVDEAQDVNPVQHELLSLLSIESEMIVGDPQQSIYAFRFARPEIFNVKAEAGELVSLDLNFRSDPGIVSFINTVFGRAWGEGYSQMISSKSPRPGDDDLFGAVLPLETVQGVEIWHKNPGEQKYSAKTIVARVKELIEEGVIPGDIMILVKQKKLSLSVCQGLNAAGIACIEEQPSGQLLTRMEARDLANALTAISDPLDRHAWLSFLHSPFAGLSLDSLVSLPTDRPIQECLEGFTPPYEPDLPKLERLMNWLPDVIGFGDRKSAWELMSLLVARSPFLAETAKQREGKRAVANVRRLLLIAADRPELSPQAFASELREMSRLGRGEMDAVTLEPGPATVRVGTQHSSKGLEHPVVIVVPDTGNPFRGKVEIQHHKRNVILPIPRQPQGPLTAFIKERSHEAGDRDDQRLLYVAMTRAKQRLCLVLPASRPTKGPGAWLWRFLPLDPAPPGLVVRGGQPHE